ncbi:thiamine pyrophosphate-dependent acetolactate synthase large subunit-like protein [Novosphingobium chloroacetimidivorans]|uniref:Thiamine pyrophosphate-dependent acetolactate synthase large subunit-like protein n=1 Tax=Novosphingobium chloroacetimidivorans TaxID=1428314 RepID=A0A7W7K903_9SPHN|nr:thiamine pyrophosphate-binding protein [Novosphingobium chloroacetimidivorans]MBB4858431.1 thiamine pyrophosphate-dependent acetolactate synthase large subunit-like protein [Novosphingobium chloroacetimidivorans]
MYDNEPQAQSPTTNTGMIPVYKRMLDLFEAEGINTLFGIPDPNFVHLFLEAETRGWTVVSSHHEASSAHMAAAAARITGKPAVCIATLGPGLANAMPGVQCAKVENDPIIIIAGQRARVTERRVRRGRIQFVRQEPLIEDSVKFSSSIEYGDQVDEIIREAMRVTMSGTPGPAYIELPQHVILEDVPNTPILPPSRYRLVNAGADGDRIAEAAKIIMAAKNPILLVGHGVHTSKSGAAVKELADLMQCPVIQTSGGTSFIEGLEDRTFPYGFSEASIDAVVESDCCVALATELGEPSHYGRWRHWVDNEANRKWIYVQQDATAIGVNRPIDVPLVGDVRGVVPQLSRALKELGSRQATEKLSAYIQQDAQQLAELAEEAAGKPDGSESLMHTSQFVTEATKAFPADGIMIRDGGATVVFQWTYSQCKPHDVIWNQNYGHIGTGLPYATGAMLADRAATGVSRPGMLLTSDSSFLFHIGELEVAVRENLNLVCVVGVDFQWGLEVGVYKRTFGHGTKETGTHWSDKVRFDKIGEGFGAAGEFVTKAADLGPAIDRAYARGGVTVIHVPIDPKANSEEMPNYSEFRTWYAEGTQ